MNIKKIGLAGLLSLSGCAAIEVSKTQSQKNADIVLNYLEHKESKSYLQTFVRSGKTSMVLAEEDGSYLKIKFIPNIKQSKDSVISIWDGINSHLGEFDETDLVEVNGKQEMNYQTKMRGAEEKTSSDLQKCYQLLRVSIQKEK